VKHAKQREAVGQKKRVCTQASWATGPLKRATEYNVGDFGPDSWTKSKMVIGSSADF